MDKNFKSEDTIDNKYIIIEEKGCGTTSEVFLIKDPITKINYSAKIFKEPIIFFDIETEILDSLKPINCPYIVNLVESKIGTIIRKNNIQKRKQYMILEYVEKGELFNYIYYTNKGLGEKYSKLIFLKILKGIKAFHDIGICHRDLKMQNILVDGNINPKICDFGFATFNTSKLNDYLGTLNYMAPEILLKKPYDGYKADIFSLGVLLLALITCKIGFNEASKRDPFYKLIMIKHYKQYWKHVGSQIKGVSEQFKKLYNKMVSFKPEDRPTIEQILNDDWMKDVINLNKKQYNELENEIKIEFFEREKIIKEKLSKLK